MTKSTITREQITSWMNDANYALEEPLNADDAAAARAILAMGDELLAAMDSEPYGYVNQFLYEQNGVSGLSNDHEYYHDSKSHIPLYRHAQPAPVVPEEMTPQQASRSYGGEVRGYRDGWNACRAAMLQAQPSGDGEPTDDERIMAIEGIHNCERCGDEGWVAGEMGITRCECSQAGKSQVNGVTTGKPLTITLPDISSKAFWSGAGKNENFHPETYRRWAKEAIERACIIARIDVEVK